MTVRRGHILPLVAALLVAGAPAFAQAPAPTPAPSQVFSKLSDAEIAERVQAVIDRFKGRRELVGLSIAVGYERGRSGRAAQHR